MAYMENPMRRSGIALAGAQRTIDGWCSGVTTDPVNHGIVTAADIGELPLTGSWLVTLSACDTGLGQIRQGKGVLGIRRGFVRAVVKNLLMSLWNVSDDVDTTETTPSFMRAFYDEALRTGDAAQALARVQRVWLSQITAKWPSDFPLRSIMNRWLEDFPP